MLIGCSKVKQSEKRMDGNWVVTDYQTTDKNGFTVKYDNVSGTGVYKLNPNTLDVTINYTLNGQEKSFSISGEFIMQDEENYTIVVTDSNGTLAEHNHNRNLAITKTDYRTSINDGQFSHTILYHR